MIASLFSTIAQDPPDTIIVIGPNHKLIGANEIHTSTADWGTAFGTLKADRGVAGEIIEKMKASENNTLMEDEHSVSGLVPYIKYYLPDTKIVPILLHGSYTMKQSKELGELLAEIVSEKPDTIILASTDFSHYLDVIEADKKDKITLAAINSWNIDELSRMSNDNLDSVPSVTTLLNAMDTIGAKGIEVTGHSNSSRIAGSGYDYTTSYFTMFFRLQDLGYDLP
jgi:AmmeMemoRadiSam system protein B